MDLIFKFMSEVSLDHVYLNNLLTTSSKRGRLKKYFIES